MIGPTSGIGYQAYQQRSMPSSRQEQVVVNSKTIPAEMSIKTRNSEISVDFDRICEEIGFLKLDGQLQERVSIAQREVNEKIDEEVRAGRRARDFHKEPGNVFGKIAYEKFLADRQTQVELDAAPRFGAKIDIRVFPPEIRVDTNVKAGTNIL